MHDGRPDPVTARGDGHDTDTDADAAAKDAANGGPPFEPCSRSYNQTGVVSASDECARADQRAASLSVPHAG